MVTSDGILATACADGTLFLWSVPSLELHQMYHTPNMVSFSHTLCWGTPIMRLCVFVLFSLC